jgi:hypothetical protein
MAISKTRLIRSHLSEGTPIPLTFPRFGLLPLPEKARPGQRPSRASPSPG